jgi:adenosine deaminase
MEGSIRLSTLLEVRRVHGMPLPGTGELDDLVQVNREDEYTSQNFLSKFLTLRQFYKTPEIIARITRETIADAADDNVRYLELRFTPVALSRVESFPISEVLDWVVDAVRDAEKDFNIITRLIVSVNRHESPDLAEQVAQLSVDRMDKGIIGLDLAGDEANHTGLEFKSIFKDAQKSGLHITIHAGEWAGAESVRNAILHLDAERIGHGIRVIEDPGVTALAREKAIPFEICLTSNVQSGVVPQASAHPLPQMLSLGINATINTDDPSISQITLSDEYRFACEVLELPFRVLKERILSACQAAFLPEREKGLLYSALSTELKQYKKKG